MDKENQSLKYLYTCMYSVYMPFKTTAMSYILCPNNSTLGTCLFSLSLHIKITPGYMTIYCGILKFLYIIKSILSTKHVP